MIIIIIITSFFSRRVADGWGNCGVAAVVYANELNPNRKYKASLA